MHSCIPVAQLQVLAGEQLGVLDGQQDLRLRDVVLLLQQVINQGLRDAILKPNQTKLKLKQSVRTTP